MNSRQDLFVDTVRENREISSHYDSDSFGLLLNDIKAHIAIYSEDEWIETKKMLPQLRAVLKLQLKKHSYPESEISTAAKNCIEKYENSVIAEKKENTDECDSEPADDSDDTFITRTGLRTQKWLLDFIDEAERIANNEDYKGKIILPGKNDVDVLEMARFFATRATRKEPKICSKIGVNYQYDVLHTTKWFAGQVSTKVIAYEHKTQNHSARKTYNCFRNSLSLLWIAVVLGEDDDTLIRAAHNMNQSGNNLSSQCAAVRKVIPFDRIMVLWRNRPEK